MKLLLPFIVLLSVLLPSCTDQSGGNPWQEPVYIVTTKDKSDEVIIRHGESGTIMDIHSFTGIGSAKFELESGDLPKNMIARLYLAGLEEVRFSSAKNTIAASFSSNSVLNSNNQRIISLGEEYPITPAHPLWLNIRVVSPEAPSNAVPAETYFEITFPKGFIEESGSSFEIHWIDFYR